MGNEYGQTTQSEAYTSMGQAIDVLNEMFIVASYGIYASHDDAEPVETVSGFPQAVRGKLRPKSADREGGFVIVEPAIYAEQALFERAVWRLIRRELARLNDLERGLCIRCHEVNDQPRQRRCSRCSA